MKGANSWVSYLATFPFSLRASYTTGIQEPLINANEREFWELESGILTAPQKRMVRRVKAIRNRRKEKRGAWSFSLTTLSVQNLVFA